MKAKENPGHGVITYTVPYSEAHVSADLSDAAMLFLELTCQRREKNKPYGEMERSKNTLAQFGFSNSQNAHLLNAMSDPMAEFKKANDTLAFLDAVCEKFGPDALVVRYDHFFQILEKYDMVCGSFDRYTGGIPQSALDTLTRLNEMWERKEIEQKYALGLSYTGMYVLTNEEEGIDIFRKRLRMPLRTNNKAVCAEISNLTGVEIDVNENENHENLTDVLFIAAPAADMIPLKVEVRFETDKFEELRRAEPKTSTERAWRACWANDVEYASKKYYRLRAEYDRLEEIRRKELRDIDQAVKNEEERLKSIFADSDINRYAEISFIHREAEIVRLLRDPFICSLTPFGVLIHAKWGAEAEDATIKRYEQLRDEIILTK